MSIPWTLLRFNEAQLYAFSLFISRFLFSDFDGSCFEFDMVVLRRRLGLDEPRRKKDEVRGRASGARIAPGMSRTRELRRDPSCELAVCDVDHDGGDIPT